MNLGGIFSAAGQGLKMDAPINMQNAETDVMRNNLMLSQQQQQSRALAAQILQNMARSGPAAPTMTPVPGAQPGSPPPGAASPPAGGAGGGFTPESLMHMLGSAGGTPQAQFGAFEQIAPLMNPYARMQNQAQLQQMKLDAQQDMLEQRLQELGRQKDLWADVTKRGQDIRADTSGENRESREGIAAANRSSREGIASQSAAARAVQKATGGGARGAGKDPETDALEKQVMNTRTILTTLLNNFRGPGDPTYDEMKKQYDLLNSELSAKRTKVAPTASAGAVASAPANAPADTDIAYLKAHPEARDQFDAHFGAGSAAKILGK